MKVEKFQKGLDNNVWNEFLKHSKNSTFLFDRNFMDYHNDRFTDHSLMVYDEKNKLIACFPANENDLGVIWSHQGLSYGGLTIKSDAKLPVYLKVFRSILRYYNQKGIETIRYKAFPRFYNELQTDEIEYCLFLCQANLYRRDTALTIHRDNRIPYSGNIRRESKKALKGGIKINKEDDFECFWNSVLVPNLQSRFSVNPVHTIEEIVLLKERFPNNIQLFTARNNVDEILAGTVIFETKNVAHCQYISANYEGRRSGALNLLFTTLIDKFFLNKKFFDFGTANEDDGKNLNTGLLAWKERMGGRTYSHDFYEIHTNNYRLLG